MSNAFFYDLLASVAERGRSMLKVKPWPKDADKSVERLVEDCRALVEGRRQASEFALAAEVIGRYARSIRRSCGLFQRTRRRFRSRSRSGPGRGGQVRVGWRRSVGERNPLRLRATSSRAVPAGQSRTWGHLGASRDARRLAPVHEAEPLARHCRSRFSAFVRVVVQSWVSGVASRRLVLAGGFWRRSSATRRCTKSATGTNSGGASIRPTGDATRSSIRGWSTSR